MKNVVCGKLKLSVKKGPRRECASNRVTKKMRNINDKKLQ